MATKYTSKGCILQVDISSVYTTVAQTTNLTFPDGQVTYFDATTLDSGVSVEDGELTGHATPGSCTAELFYDPADAVHKLLAGDPENGGVYRDFKFVMPDSGSSVVTLAGSVQSFIPKAQVLNGFMADLTIKLRSMATYPA